MRISVPRLSVQKGSSINARLEIDLQSGESLTGCRASAYIKSRASDSKIICVLDAKINSDNTITISADPPRSDSIPAGQLVYYVEMVRGLNSKIVERNYLNVEP